MDSKPSIKIVFDILLGIGAFYLYNNNHPYWATGIAVLVALDLVDLVTTSPAA